MPKYVFAYHGTGKIPETDEEGAQLMADWEAWFASMGEAVIDMGNPVGESTTVTANGVVNEGGPNPISGYSLIQADTVEAAAELAKGCPILVDGSIEIAEAMEM